MDVKQAVKDIPNNAKVVKAIGAFVGALVGLAAGAVGASLAFEELNTVFEDADMPDGDQLRPLEEE